MNFKKNFVNYIAWGLMCVILFAGVGVSAIGVSEKAESNAYLIYVGAFYLIFLVLIALIIPVFKAFKEFLESKLDFGNFKLEGILETIFICVIVAASVIIRFAYAITVFLKADTSDVILGTTAYFDFAQGTVTSLGTANNGAYIYSGILMRLFGLISENAVCVYVLQTVLALGTMLFIFFTLRKLSGKIPAWIYLLLAAFLPGSLELFMYCTPGLMLAFLFSGFFFGMTQLIKAYQEDKITDSKIYVYFVLAGALAGFIAYFDPIGLVLIPISAYAIYAFRKVYYDDRKPEKHENTKLHITYFVAGALVFLIFALFAFPAGIGAGISGIARYFTLFVPKGLNLTILTPHYGNYDALALYVFAGLWFLAFLKALRDRVFPMTVITICMVLFCLLSFDHLDYSALVSTCFIIFSCYGLKSLSFLILPVEAENVEQARQKLAELDRKKRTKDNKRLEKKLEKQSQRAIKHGSGIVLGKNIEHDIIADEEEAKQTENITENTTETTVGSAENQNTENVQDTVKDTETKKDETSGTTEVAANTEAAGTTEVAANTEAAGTTETTAVTAQTESSETNKTTTEEQTSEVSDVNVTGDNTVQQNNEVSDTEVLAEESDHSENEAISASEAAVDNVATAETTVSDVNVSVTDNEVVTNVAETNAETVVSEAVVKETGTTTNENTETVQKNTVSEEKNKRVLPPYVPAKMVRTRGKMFSPVKKAEPAPENNEPDAVGAELANVAVAVAAGAAVAGAVADTAEEKKSETTAVVGTESAEADVRTSEVQTAEMQSTEEPVYETILETIPETASENTSETVVENATNTIETTSDITSVQVSDITSEATAIEASGDANVALVPASPRFENASKQETGKDDAAATKDASSESSVEPEVKLIKNPVPGPKEHVAKELAFDYDPRDDELDFDLKDLDGKDFYDI